MPSSLTSNSSAAAAATASSSGGTSSKSCTTTTGSSNTTMTTTSQPTTVVPLKDIHNNNTPTTTTTTTTPTYQILPSSHLARPATPEQAQHQKRWMIGFGLLYAIGVGVSVLLLVHKWLGSNAGLGASLGQIMGYGISPVLLWAVGRVTGLRVGFRPNNNNNNNAPAVDTTQQEQGDATNTEEGPVVAVVDVIEGPYGNHLALLQNGNTNTVPQPFFYRIASPEETKQQTILLLKYGIVFVPLGIAPLVVLVSWQGSFLPDAIGCWIGYVAGSLYYPVILRVVSYSTGQRLLWMHRQRVCLIAEDYDTINHPGKSHGVPQGKELCENA